MFEKTYKQDPDREHIHEIEKHPSIELSDEMIANGLVYRVITLHNEPPQIPMDLDMPILEKSLRQGKKDEKIQSKSTKSKPSKTNTKANKPAMAKAQKKL